MKNVLFGFLSFLSISSTNDIVYMVIEGVILFMVILTVLKRSKETILKDENDPNNKDSLSRSVSTVPLYEELDEDKIKKVVPNYDKNEFNNMVFNLYKDIQISFMNEDTKKISELSTEDICKMYCTQINILKAKNQKNKIEDIELIESKIIGVNDNEGIQSVEVYLNVRCYDYVIKESNHAVVKGRNNRKLNVTYILTLVKKSNKFVLSKKQIIGQHVE